MKKLLCLNAALFLLLSPAGSQEPPVKGAALENPAELSGEVLPRETVTEADDALRGKDSPAQEEDFPSFAEAEPPSEAGDAVEADTAAPDTESRETVPYKQLSLPGADRAEVEKFRKMYLDPKWTKHLYTVLEAAIEYRLYVRNCLEGTELPPELEYLPVVESNYKTNAKSRSGALGMWQFMENSVRPFLTLNEYVDERLDPWKSTDGALKKLQDNYRLFNDWSLAIAAYNCGAGALTRILAKAEQKDFWYLLDKKLLPAQTADYVPKLIAIADLVINAGYYGVELPLHTEEYELLYNEKNAVFDYVTVSKAYSLTQLAGELRMDASALKGLNPSFVKGFTHPAQKSQIRLPPGMQEAAENALEKITPIEFPFKYTVVQGDSLWSISRKYGITVSRLCELNGIEENAILRIGKILYIPSK